MEQPSPFAPPRDSGPVFVEGRAPYFDPSRVVVYGLYTNAVASLASMGGSLAGSDTLIAVGALFQLAVFVVCIVCWGIWMVRAAKNLRALEPEASFEYTPGWAFGYFFIPFVNLVRPLGAMKEIWQHSLPGGDDDVNPALLNNWWGLWIFSNILSNISARVGEGTAGTAISVVAEASSIGAALAAAEIIKRINAHQEKKAHGLGLSPSRA